MYNKILDIIPKAIAIFTSLLIFLGIISSVVYYRAFSINILDQITIGEALLLFVSKFSPFAIAAIFGIIISKLYLLPTPQEEGTKVDKADAFQKAKLRTGQKVYALFIIIPLFLLSFMGFSPFILWILPLSFVIRIYVLFYIIRRLRVVFQYRHLDKRTIDYIQIAGLSLIVVASMAMTEAYLVYTRRTEKEVTLYYSTGEIKKSDSATLYLGKTLSFYYLYHKPTEKAIIIKADQINRVEIERKR